jgi:RHO1 GDP-GTP exchange protein 1/2
MVFKGPLKRRGGSQGDSGELLVFLLDHALLMVKQKNKAEQYKVYRRVSHVQCPSSLTLNDLTTHGSPSHSSFSLSSLPMNPACAPSSLPVHRATGSVAVRLSRTHP